AGAYESLPANLPGLSMPSSQPLRPTEWRLKLRIARLTPSSLRASSRAQSMAAS
ncbi:unnamed protein product, partial [marine sediment metagenome]